MSLNFRDAKIQIKQEVKARAIEVYCEGDIAVWQALSEEQKREYISEVWKTFEFTWQDRWKYGNIVRGVGINADGINIHFGSDATPQQQTLLNAIITNMSKWAQKIEHILDNPPTAEEQQILKTIKKFKLFR